MMKDHNDKVQAVGDKFIPKLQEKNVGIFLLRLKAHEYVYNLDNDLFCWHLFINIYKNTQYIIEKCTIL